MARVPSIPRVHRLKITLRGSQPPIWRRMEVPSTIRLDWLHEVLQSAFDWENYHMWVFSTDRGEYGEPDPGLGFRAASGVSLAGVAPTAGARLRYTYDFGDDWYHDILVEAVDRAAEGVAYPRCTGGRRAGPPEDSGGIGGYGYLLQILADTDHPEHAERLEWLGLTSAAEFDPAAFDRAELDKLLAGTAEVLVPADS
jgi:hypothetical protein